MIFLGETFGAAFGPWKTTVFAHVDFDLAQISLPIAYVMLTGLILGYLADGERQFRAEISAINTVMREPRIEHGFSGSVARVAELLRDMFQAAAVDVVIQDIESGNTLLWHATPRRSSTDGAIPRRLELCDGVSGAWLADVPGPSWCSRRPRATERCRLPSCTRIARPSASTRSHWLLS